MPVGKNEMEVEILDDGRVKIETGNFAGPIHTVADNFLKELQLLLGGDVEVTKAKHTHAHTHAHNKAEHKH